MECCGDKCIYNYLADTIYNGNGLSKYAMNTCKRFYNTTIPKRRLVERGSGCCAEDVTSTVENQSFIVERAKKVRYEYGHYGQHNERRKYYIEYISVDNWIVKRSGQISSGLVRENKLKSWNYAFEIC